MIALALQNALTSNVLSQSYAVPEPYSLIVAIIIIALAIWIGYVFIKDIIKAIILLIALYLLASIGYSFFTTGSLSLQGLSGFTSSILEFFKYVLAAPHIISNMTHINSTSTISNTMPTNSLPASS